MDVLQNCYLGAFGMVDYEFLVVFRKFHMASNTKDKKFRLLDFFENWYFADTI